jgi:hypothetical protein
MDDAAHNIVADVMSSGVILLGAALLAVLIFRKLGLGAVLGYLVAGIIIGPDGLALIGDAETMLGFAEIGIILLLFLVGLELSPARLWQMRRDIFLLGGLQVVVCGLAMFAVIKLILPFSWQAALVLGLPLARTVENRLRRKKLFNFAVSGCFHRSIADYRGRAIACSASGRIGNRMDASHLCDFGDCGIGDRGPIFIDAFAAVDRQNFRAGVVHCRGSVCGMCQRGVDANDWIVRSAWRICCRSDAG